MAKCLGTRSDLLLRAAQVGDPHGFPTRRAENVVYDAPGAVPARFLGRVGSVHEQADAEMGRFVHPELHLSHHVFIRDAQFVFPPPFA